MDPTNLQIKASGTHWFPLITVSDKAKELLKNKEHRILIFINECEEKYMTLHQLSHILKDIDMLPDKNLILNTEFLKYYN